MFQIYLGLFAYSSSLNKFLTMGIEKNRIINNILYCKKINIAASH